MSIEAMRQALEALQGGYGDTKSWHKAIESAIEALRTAIQQADAQQVENSTATGEPVVVQHRKPVIGWKGKTIGYTAWRDGKGLDGWPHRELYDRPAPSVPDSYESALAVLLDFAQTVGGSSSFWEEVWPEHEAAMLAAKEAP